MNAMKRCDGAIDAGELHHDETVNKRALTEAAKSAVWRACDTNRAVIANEFKRKFSATPILVDDGRNLLFRERPHATEQNVIRRADEMRDLVEIRVDGPGRRASGRAICRPRGVPKKACWRRLRFHGMLPRGTTAVILVRIAASLGTLDTRESRVSNRGGQFNDPIRPTDASGRGEG